MPATMPEKIMEIIKDIEQGSEEWHSLRLGIITMSPASCLLVKGKGEGGFGAGALTYMHELIAERFSGLPSAFFSTEHTERGHRDEPIAMSLYEMQTGNDVDLVTIILNHDVGYSPDGLVGNDGLTEVKSKLGKLQVDILLKQEVPKDHETQIQGGLWVSEREWLDFISYSEGLPLFVKRVYRDEDYIRMLSQRVKDFYEIMQEKIEIITKL